jgi:DNA-binding transcriptional regulator GbsR (MarR family)
MENLKDIENKKKEIVEKYGMFMEKHENFPPIAARIFSTLLLSEQKGATFEELVNFLGASKSTVSTNLQKLSKMNIVEYHTKPGDRKKYFTLSPVGFIAFLDEDIKKFKAEKALVEEVLIFKLAANKIITDPSQKFQHVEKTAFLDYLENSIKGLAELKVHVQNKCFDINI